VKFTQKGSVELTATALPLDENSVQFAVSVRDTGIGIPESQHHKIFKRFSQADSGISRKFGGTGLGLAISKQLMEVMKGEIGFESSTDSGSRFWFTLPLKLAEGEELSAQEDTHDLNLSALNILAVDDNTESLKMLSLMFEELGAELRTAESGEESLRLLQDEAFDLILMDMQMPGLDGLQTTRKIRELPNFKRKTPVVAFTANAMEGDRERCLSAGMNDYLTKPIHLPELLKVLKRWV